MWIFPNPYLVHRFKKSDSRLLWRKSTDFPDGIFVDPDTEHKK
jgi:hypothetical protein